MIFPSNDIAGLCWFTDISLSHLAPSSAGGFSFHLGRTTLAHYLVSIKFGKFNIFCHLFSVMFGCPEADNHPKL